MYISLIDLPKLKCRTAYCAETLLFGPAFELHSETDFMRTGCGIISKFGNGDVVAVAKFKYSALEAN